MSPANLPITRREYKLMLNPDRFREREAGVDAFLDLLKFQIDRAGGTYVTQEEIDRDDAEEKGEPIPQVIRRVTRYLDTPELAFDAHHWSLRLREEEDEKPNLTLKYRGADRYLSAFHDVSSPEGGKPKFEEDVLPPFSSRFSRSNKVKFKDIPEVPTVEAAAELFPVLGDLGIPGQTKVQVANGFTAFEVVHHIGGFRFGDVDPVKMSVSFWYLQEPREGWPMVGEFSFDYDPIEQKEDDALEQFHRETVEGAGKVFRAVQLQAGWLDPSGTTKTAFALSGL